MPSDRSWRFFEADYSPFSHGTMKNTTKVRESNRCSSEKHHHLNYLSIKSGPVRENSLFTSSFFKREWLSALLTYAPVKKRPVYIALNVGVWIRRSLWRFSGKSSVCLLTLIQQCTQFQGDTRLRTVWMTSREKKGIHWNCAHDKCFGVKTRIDAVTIKLSQLLLDLCQCSHKGWVQWREFRTNALYHLGLKFFRSYRCVR